MIKALRFLIPLCGIAPLCPSSANAAALSGHIINVQAYPAGAGNFAFRITTDNPPTSAQCSSSNFFYADTAYNNYQALVATALTAFSLGKTISVDFNTGTYCSINGIVVFN